MIKVNSITYLYAAILLLIKQKKKKLIKWKNEPSVWGCNGAIRICNEVSVQIRLEIPYCKRCKLTQASFLLLLLLFLFPFKGSLISVKINLNTKNY